MHTLLSVVFKISFFYHKPVAQLDSKNHLMYLGLGLHKCVAKEGSRQRGAEGRLDVTPTVTKHVDKLFLTTVECSVKTPFFVLNCSTIYVQYNSLQDTHHYQ